MKKLYYAILIFIFFQSCAPIKTVVDTSCSGYKKENFKREFIPEMKLGIMPVLGGDNKEQYRRPMGDAMGKYFKKEFGDTNIITTDNVILNLNDNNLTDSYTKAINLYQTTGIIPKQLVNDLGKSLKVKYLLYTRLLSDSEIGIIYMGKSSQTILVNEIYVQCQIWDTEIGDVVWEGKGGIAKLPEDNTNIIEKTAEGLSKTVGNIANYGTCEDKQTLINSSQQASNNTQGVILMISTILSLIIIFSI